MIHGQDDPMVLHEWGKKSFDKLQQLGVNSNFLSYPELGHSANEQEIKDCASFIQRVLPQVLSKL